MLAGCAVRMSDAYFYDAASGLLTREAFSFMLDHHLKQAQRAQEFLTLVIFIAEREFRDIAGAADELIVKELSRLIRYAVRSTDLLARTADGVVSLLLVGIDLDRARRVIARINQHLRRYFPSPALRIRVGAACCPTDANTAADLLQQALSHPVES
jgi:GGDEF domain-containing protein